MKHRRLLACLMALVLGLAACGRTDETDRELTEIPENPDLGVVCTMEARSALSLTVKNAHDAFTIAVRDPQDRLVFLTPGYLRTYGTPSGNGSPWSGSFCLTGEQHPGESCYDAGTGEIRLTVYELKGTYGIWVLSSWNGRVLHYQSVNITADECHVKGESVTLDISQFYY